MKTQKTTLTVKKDACLTDDQKTKKRSFIPLLQWLEKHPIQNIEIIFIDSNYLRYEVSFIKPINPYFLLDASINDLMSTLLVDESLFDITIAVE